MTDGASQHARAVYRMIRGYCRIEMRQFARYDGPMTKDRMKKLTVSVPEELLRKARRASKDGITPTVRKGLELVVRQDVYDRLAKLRGKIKFGMSWKELRGKE